MFEDAAVLGDPLLPSLEKLILSDISLNAQKVYANAALKWNSNRRRDRD
jgi:hypothetical protein